MKYGHIMTVGISLMTNDGGNLVAREYNNRRTRIQRLNNNIKGLNAPSVNSAQLELVAKDLLTLDLEKEFDYRPARNDHDPRDRLPQELSYLYKFKIEKHNGQWQGPDEVRYVCSDTPDSKHCADIINRFVTKHTQWQGDYRSVFNAGTDYAPDVDANNGARFQKNGFHNWLDKIKDKINELRGAGCDIIFLNITGGYKGTVPYSSLMGMLSRYANVKITYLFEESQDIIEMPIYPVGLDFFQWHENALRLRMMPAYQKYFTLDPPMKNLLADEGGLSTLGQILQEQYHQMLEKNTLQIYSRHIIDRLLKDRVEVQSGEKAKFIKILNKLLEKSGDVIWVGDKLPEMVEHAQRHHHDLLEFAELFLTPILKEDPNFLNSREIFVLLATIMLHDCGHALNRVELSSCKKLEPIFGKVTKNFCDNLLLFPGDVRDYHSYLACLRLNDANMAKTLDWPGAIGFNLEGLPEILHTAVMLACLYHRRRMDFNQNGDGIISSFHLTGQNSGRLDSISQQHELSKYGLDIMKIVALVRLIDGCDSQTRRAGQPANVDMILSMLERDAETHDMRRKVAEEAFSTFVASYNNNEFVTEHFSSGVFVADNPQKNLRLACWETLKFGDDVSRQAARLWLMTAEIHNQWVNIHDNWSHFLKHRIIQWIEVVPDEKFSGKNFHFHVILHPDESGQVYKGKAGVSMNAKHWLGQPIKNGKTMKEIIEEEVSSEYDSVANYAFKFNLVVNYHWWDHATKSKNLFAKNTSNPANATP